MSWDGEPGTDFFGYSPHQPMSDMGPRLSRIFMAIQEELVKQAKPKGYVCFRKDCSRTAVDCELSIRDLAKRIEQVLGDDDESTTD